MSEEWEWVRGCPGRNKGYYRKKPFTRPQPTLPQRRFRHTAAKVAHDSTGQTGLREYGDKEIPAVTAAVGQALKGRRFAPPKPKRVPEVLERLKPILEEVGRAVASMKSINRDLVPRLLLWSRMEKERKEKLEKIVV